MYNIYHNYEVYIQYIQLSEEVLQKRHPWAYGPLVIFLQNFLRQLHISYIQRIVMLYIIYILTYFPAILEAILLRRC